MDLHMTIRIATSAIFLLVLMNSGCAEQEPTVIALYQDTSEARSNRNSDTGDGDNTAPTDTMRIQADGTRTSPESDVGFDTGSLEDDITDENPSDVITLEDTGQDDTGAPEEDIVEIPDSEAPDDTNLGDDILIAYDDAETADAAVLPEDAVLALEDTVLAPEDTVLSTDTIESTDTDTPAEDTAVLPPEPAPNLLANPGFEDGTEPWNIWGGAQRVESNSNSGSWAVQATNGNGAEQLVTNLEPNAIYRLTGWGKSLATEPMLVGVKNYGGPQKGIQFSSPDYEEGTLLFTTGFSNTSVIVFAYKHQGTEPGYADDLSLQLESVEANTPIWADEFNGEGPLDATKWTFEEGFVRNEELQWYQSENAFQEGGNLVIEGRTENKPNPNYIPGSTSWKTNQETINYSSASVITKDLFSFQYATVVVRAKVTNYVGTWPAIWTLGLDCKWPSRGEVDIMENYGGNILANFAWGTNTMWSPVWDSSQWPVADFGEEWTDSFHIWELQWTDTQMTILLDGQVLNDVDLSNTINGSAECADENPFQQPHFLLLNLALGSNGGSVENLDFPTQYLVDYVRIYE
jgi:beta-glucanase (GH16 family)